jgi:nicotinamide-nucleotide amidase
MDVAHRLAARVGDALKRHQYVLTTAESCTGGWVAQMVTSIPGSSEWFDRGYVTYSNRAKDEMLGVSPELVEAEGAVSDAVVRAMAEGALERSGADVAVAISGIAGPEGGTPQKPVGTIWMGWAARGCETRTRSSHYAGDREMVRRQAVMAALQGILDLVERLDGAA